MNICICIVAAPKGQIIRLDFRNSFHIEAKEECKFDFLEVRTTELYLPILKLNIY